MALRVNPLSSGSVGPELSSLIGQKWLHTVENSSLLRQQVLLEYFPERDDILNEELAH